MAKKPASKTRKKKTKIASPTILQRFRSNFFTGLVIVVPVFLTIWLVWTLVNFVDARVLPLVPAVYNPATYIGRNIVGFGVVVFVLFTGFIGALTKGLFGRQLIRWGEGLFDRTPFVRPIYNGVKQIVETVLNQSNSSFQDACLIEYPRKGLWAIAFVSTQTSGEVPSQTGEAEMMSVFLPTTPNPTSGFLLFVPKRDVIILDMSTEEAAKLVISAGLVTPPTAEEILAGRKSAPAALG